MSLILDAGALIAYERRDRTVRAYLERAERTETPVLTTAGVIAQVWREPARQARVARLLRGVEEVELTRVRARVVGLLLGVSKSADVVDGSVLEAAEDGDEILTSDPDDITPLANAAGKTVIVTSVG